MNGSYCPRMAPARNASRPPACRPPTFPDNPPPDSSPSPSSIDRIDCDAASTQPRRSTTSALGTRSPSASPVTSRTGPSARTAASASSACAASSVYSVTFGPGRTSRLPTVAASDQSMRAPIDSPRSSLLSASPRWSCSARWSSSARWSASARWSSLSRPLPTSSVGSVIGTRTPSTCPRRCRGPAARPRERCLPRSTRTTTPDRRPSELCRSTN